MAIPKRGLAAAGRNSLDAVRPEGLPFQPEVTPMGDVALGLMFRMSLRES